MSAPRTDLKVGFACNNRCVFCAQGEKRRGNARFDFDELVDRMKKAYRPGAGLVLTGGEPTLHPDLPKLVHAARHMGYRPVQVQTNGQLLSYAKKVELLMRAGAEEFSPSLHGSTAEVHDGLTRAPGSFEYSKAGIRNVVAAGAIVVTNTVVTKQNLHCLVETVELLHSLGVREMQLALVHPVGTAHERMADVVPPIEEAGVAIRKAVRRGMDLGMRMMVEAMPPCLMRGVEEAIVEDMIPETTVMDMDGEAFAFSDWRRDEGKAKGPPCERCAKNASCEGPWREYPARDGWDAYEPFTD